LVGELLREVRHMAGEFDELKAAVADIVVKADAIEAVLDGVVEKFDALIAAGGTIEDVKALTESLKAETADLAANALKNTR